MYKLCKVAWKLPTNTDVYGLTPRRILRREAVESIARRGVSPRRFRCVEPSTEDTAGRNPDVFARHGAWVVVQVIGVVGAAHSRLLNRTIIASTPASSVRLAQIQ